MDSVFSGFVLDPVKCRELSLDERRELVHEIAQWSKNAPEILSSFTRRELLEIICAEMGKERKYTGFTKYQMIEHLLKLVSEKTKKLVAEKALGLSPSDAQTGSKRKRLKGPSSTISSDVDDVRDKNAKEEHAKVRFCQNVVCQAVLDANQVFCSRCSCCICHQFDDNKDPSLWLTCGSDYLNEKEFCGVSCHLKCALGETRTRTKKIGHGTKLDGSYCCVHCGKINCIMRSWRKQLLKAKETRRVDALCLRISLGHRILYGTVKYTQVQKIVESALKLLEGEVGGPLDFLCTKMARGIVNRLSCGAEIQGLCASAIEAFDSMCSRRGYMEKKDLPGCWIHFEEPSPTSVIILLEYADHVLNNCVRCKIWHRKSTAVDYPDEPTFMVLDPQKRFEITDLDPSTEYAFKVSLFNNEGLLGVCEARCETFPANKISISKEPNVPKISIAKPRLSDDVSKNSIEESKSTPFPVKTDSLMSHTSISPPTPCKSIGTRAVPQAGATKGPGESEYEYCVRVVKRLEQDGYIEGDFRVKFLTWFSLKATAQERRVVSVFGKAFSDDPQGLAGQLVHTFSDEISGEQKLSPCHGFCTKVLH